ncbi:MAG: DUF4340 domain-containing protein [Armatimonadetes bacterium]|nr:DUF4340 domain-containing protein [Armatimonadota bacterium]
MKPLRSTFVLFLLALGGGLYIYFNERGAPVAQGAVVLLRAPRESVRVVKLSPANVELRRAGESWQVQSGRRSAPANPDAVRELLDALELVQSQAPVENAANLQQYGLDKATARLVVDGKSLDLGLSPLFDPSLVYARSGEQIALVSADLSAFARRRFEGWRVRAGAPNPAGKTDAGAQNR